MDSHDYKVRCTKPDAFSRGALTETLRVLSERKVPQAALIESILAGPIIDKPAPHGGGQHTDCFSVSGVSKEDAEVIADIFIDLEAAAVDADGEISGNGGRCAGLSDAWRNFVEEGVSTRP